MKKVLTMTVLLAASTAAQAAPQPAQSLRHVEQQHGGRLTALIVRDLLSATIACPTNALLYTIEQIDGIAMKSEKAQTWGQTGQAYVDQWNELTANASTRSRNSRCNQELLNVIESSKEAIRRGPETWRRTKEAWNAVSSAVSQKVSTTVNRQ